MSAVQVTFEGHIKPQSWRGRRGQIGFVMYNKLKGAMQINGSSETGHPRLSSVVPNYYSTQKGPSPAFSSPIVVHKLSTLLSSQKQDQG
ncbi:hypothetical protein V6N13_122241 [Hibiscus sabdariffa]